MSPCIAYVKRPSAPLGHVGKLGFGFLSVMFITFVSRFLFVQLLFGFLYVDVYYVWLEVFICSVALVAPVHSLRAIDFQ